MDIYLLNNKEKLLNEDTLINEGWPGWNSCMSEQNRGMGFNEGSFYRDTLLVRGYNYRHRWIKILLVKEI